jgi:hypothetical protein
MVYVNVVTGLDPHTLSAVTEIVPDRLVNATAMEVVPCPEAIVAPGETDQVYDVAPATGLIENISDVPSQIAGEPMIDVGAFGALPGPGVIIITPFPALIPAVVAVFVLPGNEI